MRHYRQKTVVITGACSQIGRALAVRFGEIGARVVLIDIRGEQLAALVEHLQSRSIGVAGICCDISDPKQVTQQFAHIATLFTSVDVLVNSAAITHSASFDNTDLETFQRIMAVNFFGTLHCTRAALPLLSQSRGQIITMSNMAGFPPLLHHSADTASKQALYGLFDSLRLELKDKGVGITQVSPGFMATDIRKHALQPDGSIVINAGELSGKVITPKVVANKIIQGARRNRPLITVSNVDWRTRLFARLFPNIFERHIARHVMGIEQIR